MQGKGRKEWNMTPRFQVASFLQSETLVPLTGKLGKKVEERL